MSTPWWTGTSVIFQVRTVHDLLLNHFDNKEIIIIDIEGIIIIPSMSPVGIVRSSLFTLVW